MIIDCGIEYVDQINLLLQYFNTQITREIIEDNPYSIYLGYKVKNELIGFINFNIMYDQAELNYIYVKPDYRNTSIGTYLMEAMLKRCSDSGVKEITLEVRKSNDAGVGLYKSFDFEEVSIRRGYYKDEDALLLKKVIK